MIFWYTMHSLFWVGPVSRSDELAFPLNLVSQVVNFFYGGKSDEEQDLVSRTESPFFDNVDPGGVDYIDEPTQSDAQSPEGSTQISRIYNPGSFLSQLSLNNLVNFISNPQTTMLQFIFNAAFVRLLLIMILKCRPC